jgi:glucose/arabinose dehydrogenase
MKHLAALYCLLAIVGSLCAQPYGLDTATAIGPYLNHVFPPTAPSASASWNVEVAFTNVTFNQPMFMTPYPGTNRLVMIHKPGWISTFPNRRDVTPGEVSTFLDISSRTFSVSDSGMTGFVFHPEFGQAGSTNRGFVYVTYKWRPNPDLGANGDYAYMRLSRFTVPDGQIAADPSSEVVMVQQLDRQEFHDAGCLLFGQDGYLYFSIGDEGGANDEYNVTQRLNERLLSGIFRVDVDQKPVRSHPIRRQPFHHPTTPADWPESFTTNYFVPNDNPFVNPDGSVLEEYYALGFRQPYRFSQDPVTGLIWVADSGQSTREEIDILVPGANYQWAYREGTFPGPQAPPAITNGFEKGPLWDYGRDQGGCAIGGYVYRGVEHAGFLTGKYIFVDNVSGRIWAITSDGTTLTNVDYLTSMPSGSVYGGTSSCARDAQGEIYFLKFGGTGAEQVFKLSRTTTVVPDPPALLSQLGAFTNLATLGAAPGLIPYDVNMPLWSDGARKSRWLAVPTDGTNDTAGEKISFSPTNEWRFPPGTVFVKQFDLPVDENNPAIVRRLETRFLVVDQNGGVYGVTYKWRTNGLDADLLAGGDSQDYTINTAPSGVRTQHWGFPSRLDCLTCHNANAGSVLGVKTHQLNGNISYPQTGRTDNQLRTLGHLEMFTAGFNEAQINSYLKSYNLTNTSVPLVNRVRSYIDANCSQCHRPGGQRANFDARYITPLDQQNLIYGAVFDAVNDSTDRVVRPQDLLHSMMHNRANRVGALQMPPLAKNVVDAQAVQVMADWINSLPTGPGVSLALANPGALIYGSFAVTVQFTEPVSGVTANQFIVSNGQVIGLSGSGANYALNISPQVNGRVSIQYPSSQVVGSTGAGNYASNPFQVDYDPLNQFLSTWLPFEEGLGTTTADASGHGNAGTLVNMPATAWVSGRSGQALAFDGVNNYVQISNHLGTNFTIACWVKTSQLFQQVDATYLGTGIIWADVGGPAPDFILGGTQSPGGVNRLSFFVGGAETTLSGQQEISTGQWTHLAVTRDGVGGQFKIYVNGSLDGTATGITGLLNANPGIAIGGNVGDVRYFNGLIDDVRFYSRVLSDSEVATLVPPNAPPTISPIADQTINRNSSTAPLSFTVTDAETPAGSLVVSGGSSNPTLVPNANIVFGGSGSNRMVTVTPATNQTGAATITLTVNDGKVTTSTSFTVTVTGALAAYYKLDGDALDSSGQGNHGTTNGGVVFVTGKVGTKAAQFNGTNSYVQIPVSVRNDFTIAFWAKTTATGGAPQWYNGRGFVDGEVGGVTTDFGTALVGNKFVFGVGNPDVTLAATNVINDGQWHHLAATRSGASGQMIVFVDGVQQASMTGPTGSRAAPPFLRLGGIQTGVGFLACSLDDVRLYDYALSSNQIPALMNTAPVLAPISNRVILAGASLVFTNSASDADVPAQVLTYNLVNPPTGAQINASNGVFFWRPLMAQAGTTNLLSVNVFDNGTPSLSATQSFWVTVNRPAQPGLSATFTSQGQFKIMIAGDTGPDYTVLGSTNLVNWTTLLTTNSPVPPFLFVEPNSSSFGQRFYRVLLGP